MKVRSGRHILAAASLLLAALASTALLPGCAALREGAAPPSPGAEAPSWVGSGYGAFDDGGERSFSAVGRSSPCRVGVPAGETCAKAVAQADAEAVARVNAAVDLFFNPTLDPARVDLCMYESYVRRNLSFGNTSPLVRDRVAVVARWASPDDGTVFSLARLPEADLHRAIAETEMPEETRQAFREILSSHMAEHVQAWRKARGR